MHFLNILGGWECSQPLSLARKYNLSAAIFAPGWICENFPNDPCLIGNTLKFWTLLDAHILPHPITSNFSTNFDLGFHLKRDGLNQFSIIKYQLNTQQMQPFFLSLESVETEHHQIQFLLGCSFTE